MLSSAQLSSAKQPALRRRLSLELKRVI
jgi:hypothetical protein